MLQKVMHIFMGSVLVLTNKHDLDVVKKKSRYPVLQIKSWHIQKGYVWRSYLHCSKKATLTDAALTQLKRDV